MNIARMLLICMCITNTCCIGINNVIAAQDTSLMDYVCEVGIWEMEMSK